MKTCDFAIIGGGIVGVSTAWQLKKRYPDASVLLIEKESALARHQTGHNSGVVHAGVYYPPGSLKADFCKRGAAATIAFCRENRLPFLQCGKLLVATDAVELARLAHLEVRCQQNDIETHRWSRVQLARREPYIVGLGALLVPSTAIVDFVRITSAMAALFQSQGGWVQTGQAVVALRESRDRIVIELEKGRIGTRYLIACGGLMADRIARMVNLELDFRIIPFRGEYYRLAQRHNHIVRRLIYPIPDPALPFLGVHLTRMIDGSVTVGPNAVLGWQREGYRRFNFDAADTLESLRFAGFWKLVRVHWKTGMSEFKDAFSKSGYLQRIRKYCPQLQKSDLRPWPVGIRAQAVRSDGSLVHDFLFAQTPRSLHVCNAPSPAATSAIPIGNYIVDKMSAKID